MSWSDKLKGLTVEIIRILWHYGYYCFNEILKQVHDNWFEYWVLYKTEKTMQEVDRQIEKLWAEASVPDPVFTQKEEGPTALGGEMRLSSPWSKEEDLDDLVD